MIPVGRKGAELAAIPLTLCQWSPTKDDSRIGAEDNVSEYLNSLSLSLRSNIVTAHQQEATIILCRLFYQCFVDNMQHHEQRSGSYHPK